MIPSAAADIYSSLIFYTPNVDTLNCLATTSLLNKYRQNPPTHFPIFSFSFPESAPPAPAAREHDPGLAQTPNLRVQSRPGDASTLQPHPLTAISTLSIPSHLFEPSACRK